jgi:hypothetical protein
VPRVQSFELRQHIHERCNVLVDALVTIAASRVMNAESGQVAAEIYIKLIMQFDDMPSIWKPIQQAASGHTAAGSKLLEKAAGPALCVRDSAYRTGELKGARVSANRSAAEGAQPGERSALPPHRAAGCLLPRPS